MQVRHDTQLLEQAIDLLVKRSAIPTLQAEAAAHEKIARANAFRRLATGGAIAIAAVGIGIGAMLIFGRGEPKMVSLQTSETANQEATNRASETTTEEKLENRVQPDQIEAKESKAKPPNLPSETPTQLETPTTGEPAKPNAVTVDFTKFARQQFDFLGSNWMLESGHHFKDENNASWDNAWCYTIRRVNGVDVKIALVDRPSPSAKPQAPVSPAETLESVGLNDDSARELAAKCPWLDQAAFSIADFDPSPGRPEKQALLVEQGWDAVGYDLPNMPILQMSLEQCHAQCQGESKCAAVTYNRRHSACFLKGNASFLVRSEDAVVAVKPNIAAGVRYSTLVFAKDTVVIGNSYSSQESKYSDCIMACASDPTCAGFNFDSNNMCTLLANANSSTEFRGVTSGVKAASN